MNTASPTIAPTGSLKTSPSLHFYATLVACATFFLVIAGGMVTSTGSALAVPDWPLSNGQFFPKMDGGVFYEHGHRMIAGTIGILTFILAGWLWKTEPRRGVRLFGMTAAGIVILQALLGGLTVLYRLPVPISVAHACLGQIFFCTLVCIAVLTASPEDFQRSEKMTKIQRLGLMTLGFIFIQLLAGAILRHTGRFLHLHLTGAVLVVIHVQLLSRRVLKSYPLSTFPAKLAAMLPLLVIGQLVLGYISWKTGPVNVTTAHVALGALIFAGCSIITLQSFREGARA